MRAKMARSRELIRKIDKGIMRLDQLPLWWVGAILAVAVFIPFFILGEGSVFPIHDQLDETIMAYVLNARHLWEKTAFFPELLGGIPVSGMQPSAVLFIPLYAILPALAAFLIQYLIVFLAGFFGMYLCVKKLTGSSILAVMTGGLFCMLPFQPIYGLSVAGVPLLLWCFLCLYQEKHIVLSFLLILFFGLSTHLVLIGYVVLGFWALAVFIKLLRRKRNKWILFGFCWLTGIYLVVNRSLFLELVLGSAGYVSHREELVNEAAPFWSTVREVFINSAQHADSLHRYLILPILLMAAAGAAVSKKADNEWKKRYLWILAGLALLIGIAFFYGFCRWQPVVDFKNGCQGFLRYFQAERVYWLYPSLWYLEFALCLSLWWGRGTWQGFKLLVFFLLALPTLGEVKENSYFYLNVNQINNGSGITGYISWESYYAEDLMQLLEDEIGRDMKDYRVVHLGMSPAPALMHGFYTADGYSNNYPLTYKRRFRRVIEKELEKNPETAAYFDTWGSRCYLFNSCTGTAWMLGKDMGIVYQGLEIDTEALRKLECEYVFSAGAVENAEELGWKLRGYFETEKSYWGVWMYEL